MVFVKEQQNSPPSPPLLKPRHSSVLHVAHGGKGLASKSMTSDYVIHFCVDEITADGLDLGFSVQILLPLHYVLEKLCAVTQWATSMLLFLKCSLLKNGW